MQLSRRPVSPQRDAVLLRAPWTATGFLVLVAVAGVLAGLSAGAFNLLIAGITDVLAGPPHDTTGPARSAALILAPVAAGLLYGPLLYLAPPAARRQGISDVIEAAAHNGRLSARASAVKVLASALCIGGGGSVGRVGPIVQAGAALASWAGRAVTMPERRLKILVSAGAAAGLAAALHVPLAAPLFALEVIVRRFDLSTAGSAAVAGASASLVGGVLVGDPPLTRLPVAGVPTVGQYPGFVAAGVVAGLIAVLFNRTLRITRRVCARAWRGPQWLRPVVGGALLGALLFALPPLYGVGDGVVRAALDGRFAIGFLVVLLAGKILVTSLTFGIGGHGGVFGPMLFIGATAGALFGQLAQLDPSSLTGTPVLYGLIGIAAVFSAAARAPLTALAVPVELTGQYTAVPALLIAVFAALLVARVSGSTSIFQLDPETTRRESTDRCQPLPGWYVAARRWFSRRPPGAPPGQV